MKVVVVGGGIAGLAAARRLETLIPNIEILLVERTERLGGKILTERIDGFVVEGAPDSFLSRKERGVGLCEELGLGDDLVGRRPENARSFVRVGDELHPLPEGLTGMIPTNLEALAESALLSPEAKKRLAEEPSIPAAPAGGDESIASFVSRRLGREAYDRLVEPLMTGIYGGDGEKLSLQATFPHLRFLELEHGSVLRGLAAPPQTDAYPPFLTLGLGMELLVSALATSLSRTRTLFRCVADRLERTPHGYAVQTRDLGAFDADGVVVAAPAFTVAKLLDGLDPELASAHAEIPLASSSVVTLAYRHERVRHPLDGYGYVIPAAEGSDVLACSWSSSKWEGRAPDGYVLLRVYAGRYGGRDLTRVDRDELLGIAREEIRFLGVEGRPNRAWIHRWRYGMPQYVLGHPERLERIDAMLAGHPGLALAGAAYRGVGVPDCIRSGEEAAESVARALAGARS